jgi:hypothetical protein
MTLIVGFRCQDAAVLCADSQETLGGLKSEVNKLHIWNAKPGGMDIVCGGGGHGYLTDALGAALAARMTASPLVGEEAIRLELEGALVDFHRGPVFLNFPNHHSDKYLNGLICVRNAAREVFLYKYDATVILAVHTYGLAGQHEDPYLKRLAERLYRPSPSIQQAELMGLEIINEGRETFTTIGKRTRVVIVTPNEGMRSEPRDRIEWTEAQIITQNQLFGDLRFELSSSSAQANENLWKFSNSITAMRGVYGSKYPAWPQPTIGEIEPTDDGSD